MNNFLEHKGYYGSVEYSRADNILHGKLVGIDDLVSYDGICLESLKKCFTEAVDDYLIMCEEENVQPNKPERIFDIVQQTA